MNETISPNTTIAQYTIVSKIGEGGMGVVWRARDSKLGRDVAIKVLPAVMSENADRLNRFEQEAQAAGALNHPNILSIYHIGTHEGAPYIVSELLEGETLRERMAGGALPQRKAIDYALQIAKGLAAAHDKGIVHRDIKPDNIFITDDGRVKILDFGLAKLTSIDSAASQTEVPTRKVNTDPGTVMGTMGYMSPEQLKGQPADHRSDIFSFGAILYEMLSGKRAFRGDSMAETMSAILREDPPDLSETNKTISPAFERVVRHCLEKNPAERFHSARDLAFAIESLSGTATSSGQTITMPATTVATDINPARGISRLLNSARLWMAIAALFLLSLLAVGVMYFNRSSADTNAMRLSFDPPANLSFNDVLPDGAVIAPDGRKVAFTATSPEGKTMLYVRELDSTDAKMLPGSENAIEPFWSPDSRSVAYGSNGKLKRSDLSGGNAQVLCDAARMTGGSWNSSGVILFEPDYRLRLLQVSAQGGEPRAVPMNVGDSKDERDNNPIFLPDGRKFLFRRESGENQLGIWAGSLDSPEITQVVSDHSPFAFAIEGWLIFVRNDAVVAQALDTGSNKVSGDPIPIISGQRNALGNVRRFSVSDTGILVWQGRWERDYQLVWFDRGGKQVGVVDAPVKVSVGQDPHISPDGKRLLVKRDANDLTRNNLWVIDLEKGTSLRLTSTFSQIPVWSPDGSRIAYSAGGGITVKPANGLGDAEVLHVGTNFPSDWSPDGRFIIFLRRGLKTRMDMYALSMRGERKETLLLNSAADESSPQLSPDGKWLAYASDDTGIYEIYVQPFSTEGNLGADRKRISTTGGRLPIWRRDGTELFFIAQDGQMMSSSVKTAGTEFEFTTPKALFKTRMLGWITNFHEFDVSPDGQRFLIGTLIGEPKAPTPTVILNWSAILKK
ncbi:MAG: eukaryotic-like serine/threonine-protein kinase [Blastocatellia bacterium]|nr:eukaryotic-like serine/threonine-protein kinase [Blastocatellia bacterium]